MKKSTLILIIVCISITANCQAQLSFDTGVGFFSMRELKRFQEAQKSNYPVDSEITSEFPPYWIYELSGKGVTDNNLMIGLSGALGSTGSVPEHFMKTTPAKRALTNI